MRLTLLAQDEFYLLPHCILCLFKYPWPLPEKETEFKQIYTRFRTEKRKREGKNKK